MAEPASAFSVAELAMVVKVVVIRVVRARFFLLLPLVFEDPVVRGEEKWAAK